MQRKLGGGYRFYRLAYNMFSLLTFAPIIIYSLSIEGPPVFQWSGYSGIIRILIIITAVVIIFLAARIYDMLQTFGIRQIMGGQSHRVLSKGGEIKDTGILGLIRHPFYSAVFLLIWVGNLSAIALINNAFIILYLIIGTLLEERKLMVEFGDGYHEYKKRVSMFFPYKWILKKVQSSRLRNQNQKTAFRSG
jgi:protein-S-isoprenylcysteine O-methyltransferase Ste14